MRLRHWLLWIPFLTATIWSQGLPFFSSYSVTDPRASLFFVDETASKNNFAILIPYRFPKELELLPSYTPSSAAPWNWESGVQLFSSVVPFSNQFPDRVPEGNFEPYRSKNFALLSYQPNVAYIYHRKGITLDMGLSLGMSLDRSGLSYVDIMESKIRLRYRLNRNLFSFVKNSQWELFLQLSELHRFDEWNNRLNTSLRAQDPSRSSFVGRQVYVSPGISISNSNLIFEGMVRVPLNAREAGKTLDELWAPEIQTNLGLKYLIPVPSSGKL